MHNTVLLWGDGPKQSYSRSERHHAHMFTYLTPPKSAWTGLLGAAFGVRRDGMAEFCPFINRMLMGVRTDFPGQIVTDYQFLRPPRIPLANRHFRNHEGCITKRDVIAGATFLVAFQGDPDQVAEIVKALKDPQFPLYLGRRGCVPYAEDDMHQNGLIADTGDFASLEEALASVPARVGGNGQRPAVVERVPRTPKSRMVNDVLLDCAPLVHGPRWVEDVVVEVATADRKFDPPKSTSEASRQRCFARDRHQCVLCKMRATEVHHVCYVNVGEELVDHLVSMCYPCHNTISLMEYDLKITKNRIDPRDPTWAKLIRQTRDRLLAEDPQALSGRRAGQRS